MSYTHGLADRTKDRTKRAVLVSFVIEKKHWFEGWGRRVTKGLSGQRNVAKTAGKHWFEGLGRRITKRLSGQMGVAKTEGKTLVSEVGAEHS